MKWCCVEKKRGKKILHLFGMKFTKKLSEKALLLEGIEDGAVIHMPCVHFNDSTIGRGSYVGRNAAISMTDIGRFCSIGPNLVCGWGIHPLHGISTSPCFYSTHKSARKTYSPVDKVEERKKITIGNDVFIGMNVSILDGVTIGNGAVIGAGAVVNRDIPPYAIAVGVPARVVKYRFSPEVITKLEEIKWWDWDDNKLQEVEKMFFDVEDFVAKYASK